MSKKKSKAPKQDKRGKRLKRASEAGSLKGRPEVESKPLETFLSEIDETE